MTLADPRRSRQFMELLTGHHRQLFGYIYALVRNLEDTDDLYQQTTLVLWKKFNEFQPGTNFGAWACRVARFEVLNFLQERRHARVTFDDDVLHALADAESSDAASDDSRQQALEGCLSKLGGSDRHLLQLAYGGPHNIKAVAVQVGRSAQSVYNSLSRIRQALFSCVQRRLALQEAT
jgi:RNA polymerase sigma-70 factor, ECF subfamily